MMAVCGRKGVGKTFTTMRFLREYIVTPGRKVLIVDANDEYVDVPALCLSQVIPWCHSNRIEIRRIRNRYSFGPNKGKLMTLRQLTEVLEWVATYSFNCLLLIEDINKYVQDHMPGDLIGRLVSNRHNGMDMILHYQSIGRLVPKVWQNLTVLRMHKNSEGVEKHNGKFEDKYHFLKIAENIVNTQVKNGDVRYYLHVNMETEKIYTEGVGKDECMDAIFDFLTDNYSTQISPMLNRIDVRGTGQRIYTPQTAVMSKAEELWEDHFLQ